MNACEDQSEPLGESPAVDTAWAIERGSVLGILSEADKVLATKQLAERQGQALTEIRALAIDWIGQIVEFDGDPTSRQIDDGMAILNLLERCGVI